jgi:hypothetical protein
MVLMAAAALTLPLAACGAPLGEEGERQEQGEGEEGEEEEEGEEG